MYNKRSYRRGLANPNSSVSRRRARVTKVGAREAAAAADEAPIDGHDDDDDEHRMDVDDEEPGAFSRFLFLPLLTYFLIQSILCPPTVATTTKTIHLSVAVPHAAPQHRCLRRRTLTRRGNHLPLATPPGHSFIHYVLFLMVIVSSPSLLSDMNQQSRRGLSPTRC